MTAQRKVAVEQPAAAGAANGPFVVNLCSSTTPMALTQPQTPELKRFTFFMSRRREEGRERFRLHMGYFTTLAEAEELLSIVREFYPGAWAGEAPGKKLAARAAAAAAPVAASTAPVVAKPAAQAVAPIAPLPVVPTLRAAPPKAVPKSPAAPIAAKAPVPPPKPAVVARPSETHKLSAPKVSATVMPKPAAVMPKPKDATTRLMPAPTVGRAASASPTLSDSQVLTILENRGADARSRGSEEATKGIEMLRPDDTATVRSLKEAVQDNAAVSFAVQLHWSVQPIDMSKVPPLAIFGAYTLYTVEGSRDGRKWYGLRLGFFTDAVSAKQVASYVRSEFQSVAVLPVSGQERSRATDGNGASAGDAARKRRHGRPVEEFKLLDDATDEVETITATTAETQFEATKAAIAAVDPPAPPAKPRKRTGGRVRGNEKRSPQTLEETLEILGASELEIDNGRGELLNDSGVRHLQVQKVRKNSPFAKLLDRLSERAKKD